MISITEILQMGPVMPVIVIDDSTQAVPLAQALLQGGIRTIEITLRTPAALDAMQAVAKACPEILIGAGTVTSAGLAAQARDAGAGFLVSPGTTNAVIKGAADAAARRAAGPRLSRGAGHRRAHVWRVGHRSGSHPCHPRGGGRRAYWQAAGRGYDNT